MARILIADDNSNVQKTVTLALTDLGVDVVSVNNGDAAIKKLADVSPDLVLADIFMPVRNGYEVCEYVKKDSRFSQVPVILLVGAFDPLDEREAQRVGADGILKKPFVPPDPLITMVKMLLDRSLSERLVAVSVSKPAAAALQADAPRSANSVVPPAAEYSEEPEIESQKPAPAPVSFGTAEQPIAFGELLEPAQHAADSASATVEPVDDEQVLTSTRDSALGEPVFWRSDEAEENEGEGEGSAESEENEPENLASGLPVLGWKPGGEGLPQESAFSESSEAFELVRDVEEGGSALTSSVVEPSALIVQDPASQAPLTVEAGKPQDLAANPIEWMATAPEQPQSSEQFPVSAEPSQVDSNGLAASAAIIEVEQVEDHAETAAPAAPAPSAVEPVAATVEGALNAAPGGLEPAERGASDTALPFQSPIPDWRGKPSISSDSISPAAQSPAAGGSGAPDHSVPALKPLSATEDTARSIPKSAWADLAASLGSRPAEVLSEKLRASTQSSAAPEPSQTPSPAAPATPISSIAAVPAGGLTGKPQSGSPVAPAPGAGAALANAANPAAPITPDPALVEAVVQRVLDKMRPQVVDIITREFLRPVVQALVHREIEKH